MTYSLTEILAVPLRFRLAGSDEMRTDHHAVIHRERLQIFYLRQAASHSHTHRSPASYCAQTVGYILDSVHVTGDGRRVVRA